MTIVKKYKHYNSELNLKQYVGHMVAIAVAPRFGYFLDGWLSTINKNYYSVLCQHNEYSKSSIGPVASIIRRKGATHGLIMNGGLEPR